jgi:hypothetical protein
VEGASFRGYRATALIEDIWRKKIRGWLLHETVPMATAFAVLVNPTSPTLAEAQTKDLKAAAPIRILGVVSAITFIITAARNLRGEQLLPTATRLPSYAYPPLVATFIGSIWTLRREHRAE